MIPNRSDAQASLSTIITRQVAKINDVYRGGPSLYFYHRVLELRQQHTAVTDFLNSDACVEILYATLSSWDMNSRGARMLDFAQFCVALRNCIPQFQEIEEAKAAFSFTNRHDVVHKLGTLYANLSLMETKSRLVSNSKALHFLFPNLCPPMDGKNTLQKLYGNTSESKAKFLQILQLSYDVIGSIQNPEQYLDNQWNKSVMKLFDNAIILWKR